MFLKPTELKLFQGVPLRCSYVVGIGMCPIGEHVHKQPLPPSNGISQTSNNLFRESEPEVAISPLFCSEHCHGFDVLSGH